MDADPQVHMYARTFMSSSLGSRSSIWYYTEREWNKNVLSWYKASQGVISYMGIISIASSFYLACTPFPYVQTPLAPLVFSLKRVNSLSLSLLFLLLLRSCLTLLISSLIHSLVYSFTLPFLLPLPSITFSFSFYILYFLPTFYWTACLSFSSLAAESPFPLLPEPSLSK